MKNTYRKKKRNGWVQFPIKNRNNLLKIREKYIHGKYRYGKILMEKIPVNTY